MIYSQMPLSIYYSEVCDDSCGFATKCPYEYIIPNTLVAQVCAGSCSLQPNVIINILF